MKKENNREEKLQEFVEAPKRGPSALLPVAPSQEEGEGSASGLNTAREGAATPQGQATLDAGHKYRLFTLDGDVGQVLTFVKRHDPENPDRFPGNENSYPGTTLQSVIRVLIDRTTYLQGQIPCEENIAVINNLQNCLFLLEHRAMRRHGLDASQLTQHKASFGAMCHVCGHVACNHAAQSVPLTTSCAVEPVESVLTPEAKSSVASGLSQESRLKEIGDAASWVIADPASIHLSEASIKFLQSIRMDGENIFNDLRQQIATLQQTKETSSGRGSLAGQGEGEGSPSGGNTEAPR